MIGTSDHSRTHTGEARDVVAVRPTRGSESTPRNIDNVIDELVEMADDALGARSKKVKDLLLAANRSPEGIQEAIAHVGQLSLLFVDQPILLGLERDMLSHLHTYLSSDRGKPRTSES